MAAIVGYVMFFPISWGIGILKAMIDELHHSSDPVEWIVRGFVVLLGVGAPFALVLALVINNWEKHPLSAIVYAVTLLCLFSSVKQSQPKKPRADNSNTDSVDPDTRTK